MEELEEEEESEKRRKRRKRSRLMCVCYPAALPCGLLMQLQTEGGVLPAGVLHPPVSVLVGTLHLQTEQPLATSSVRHDAVRTSSQPGPPGVDEQATVPNADLLAQRRGLQPLWGDVISDIISKCSIKFSV